jgi:hypothetical protein
VFIIPIPFRAMLVAAGAHPPARLAVPSDLNKAFAGPNAEVAAMLWKQSSYINCR